MIDYQNAHGRFRRFQLQSELIAHGNLGPSFPGLATVSAHTNFSCMSK